MDRPKIKEQTVDLATTVMLDCLAHGYDGEMQVRIQLNDVIADSVVYIFGRRR